MACCDNMPSWVSRWFGFADYVPTVPQLYWDVDGNEQRYHLLCKQLHKLICYADMLGQKININHDDIDALEKEFEKFKNGAFLEFYENQLAQWIATNMERIISNSVKMVWFGLNDDGYFVAYVPDSWDDIAFDTGAIFGRSDYGRLILRFDAVGALDNTYSYSLAQPTKVNKLIADLEVNAKRTDATFETLFTNLDEEVILNGNI